ncbi:MAG TPA: hypothetical protein VFG99_01305, partial [Chloroflexia bacterium]|nr:hypothetical protein [Chloroflexia bacterium]
LLGAGALGAILSHTRPKRGTRGQRSASALTKDRRGCSLVEEEGLTLRTYLEVLDLLEVAFFFPTQNHERLVDLTTTT